MDEALRAQAAMPPNIAHASRIQHRDDLQWPCFLVESSDGFVFGTAEEATILVARLLRAGALDDEDKRITVYHIREAFLPKVPGRDEMGRLPHSHPGATEAARIIAGGINDFWNR